MGGLFARLKDAIPTLDDALNVGVITGTGLFNEFFGYKVFDALGLQVVYKTVPYADHAIMTILETMGTAWLFGRRWAQMVMYGGLSTLARSVIAREVIAKGRAGEMMRQAAADVGYAPMADYVTYGDKFMGRPLQRGMNDFVTLGNESEDVAALDCSPGGMETEGLADYYGVTAF